MSDSRTPDSYPNERFSEPMDVVTAADLDRTTKREILNQWRADAERLAASAAEGMAGGEPAMLRQVELALDALEGRSPEVE